MATSSHYRVSPHEIETCWSLEGLMDAHAVLDAIDEAERSQARTIKQQNRG